MDNNHPDQRLINLLTTLAQNQLNAGDLQGAIKNLQRLIMRNAITPEILAAATDSCLKLKRNDKAALAIFRKTIEIKPDYAPAISALCEFYLNGNQLSAESFPLFRTAIEQNLELSRRLVNTLMTFGIDNLPPDLGLLVLKKAIEYPALREKAIKEHIQLSLYLNRLDETLELLKSHLTKFQNTGHLTTYCQLLLKRQKQLSNQGKTITLDNESRELCVRYLQTRPTMQMSTDILKIASLATLALTAPKIESDTLNEAGHNFNFFFHNLNPEVILNHGYSGEVSTADVELNLSNVIWHRLDSRLSIPKPVNGNKHLKSNILRRKKSLIGLTLKISNFQELVAKDTRKSIRMVQEMKNKLAEKLIATGKFQVRFFSDGLLALAVYDASLLQSIQGAIRDAEARIKHQNPDFDCCFSVALTLFKKRGMHNWSHMPTFLHLMELNELPETVTDDDTIKCRLLLSNELRLKLKQELELPIRQYGLFKMPPRQREHLVFELDWITPIDRLKADILQHFPRLILTDTLYHAAAYSVFKCEDDLLERPVVLRVIQKAVDKPLAGQSGLIETFSIAAKKVSKLSHSNIVQIYDIGRQGNLSYITREFFEGQNLEQWLESKPQLQTILPVFVQICAALQYAHDNDILHLNLKPSNIIIAADETIKITDFGDFNRQLKTLSDKEIFRTNLRYLAPELLLGQTAGKKSDIWAIGVMFYIAVTGTAPYPGPSLNELRAQIKKNPVVLPGIISPGLPKMVDEIIERALAVKPAERFSGFEEMRAALRSLVPTPNSAE
ncbi:protein kinase [bacterium]|nr:protein kinase [bacterium]